MRYLSDPPSLLQLALVSVEVVDTDRYRLVFEDRGSGQLVEAVCDLDRQGEHVIARGVTPDVFGRWMGDAESVRSVVAAVLAVDRARQLSLRNDV